MDPQDPESTVEGLHEAIRKVEVSCVSAVLAVFQTDPKFVRRSEKFPVSVLPATAFLLSQALLSKHAMVGVRTFHRII